MGEQICLEKLLKNHPDLENDQVLFSFPQFWTNPKKFPRSSARSLWKEDLPPGKLGILWGKEVWIPSGKRLQFDIEAMAIEFIDLPSKQAGWFNHAVACKTFTRG
jgi:hypothetical protein